MQFIVKEMFVSSLQERLTCIFYFFFSFPWEWLVRIHVNQKEKQKYNKEHEKLRDGRMAFIQPLQSFRKNIGSGGVEQTWLHKYKKSH